MEAAAPISSAEAATEISAAFRRGLSSLSRGSDRRARSYFRQDNWPTDPDTAIRIDETPNAPASYLLSTAGENANATTCAAALANES